MPPLTFATLPNSSQGALLSDPFSRFSVLSSHCSIYFLTFKILFSVYTQHITYLYTLQYILKPRCTSLFLVFTVTSSGSSILSCFSLLYPSVPSRKAFYLPFRNLFHWQYLVQFSYFLQEWRFCRGKNYSNLISHSYPNCIPGSQISSIYSISLWQMVDPLLLPLIPYPTTPPHPFTTTRSCCHSCILREKILKKATRFLEVNSNVLEFQIRRYIIL